MIQYLFSLSFLITLSFFIIEIILLNSCKLENRYRGLEVFIDGLIKDGKHHVVYKSCGLITSYKKKNSTHEFFITNTWEKEDFKLKRGVPPSE